MSGMTGMNGDAQVMRYMPHGMCFLWDPRMLTLHVLSDGMIALTYFSIPLILVFFVRKRRDLPFPGVFSMFGLFIVACGTTHVLDIWTIWHPTYWLSGAAKALTAGVSLATALCLIRVVPGALAIKGRADLAEELATVAQRDRDTASRLRKQNDLQMMAEEMAQLGHWRLDARSDTLFWSTEMYRIHGLPVTRTITHDLILSLCHPEDRERVWEVMERCLTGSTSFSLDYRIVRPDGTIRHLTARINPEAAQEPARALVGVVQDVTEAKSSENERLRLLEESAAAQQQLRQAQKMEALGQLTGGVAHDFNNLLAIIAGNLEVLGNQDGLAPPSVECIGDALRAAQRGAGLTQRLLAYSRQQQLAPSAVDVGTLLETLVRMLRRVVMESIAIEMHVVADLWTPWVDSQQLENALLNIALNARDAMPDGGILSVSAENVVFDETRSELCAETVPGDYLVVSVADTGCGMSADILERVFEPFFTTKPLGSGSGLGLSMVYGFVKQSGGFVTIESEPGHGSTVNVFLPRLAGPCPVVPTVIEVERPTALCRRRVVLVVEDDSAVRRLQLRLLHSLGYQALEAADGPSCLRALENAGRVDLLLTDVVMPGGMSGGDLARAALRLRPELKVLFMSGHAPSGETPSGDLSGVHLLRKPFTRAILAQAVQHLLEGSG